MPQKITSKLHHLALFGAIGLMLSGCVVHTRGRANYRANATFRYRPVHVVVKKHPPKVRVANARPAQPRAGAVWVEGHWSWQNRWVWVDGRWTVPERPNYVWVKPVAEARVDGSYVYHRGYWRAPSERPADVYVRSVATHDAQADGTATTRPASTRTVQVNVTPVKPPKVSASANVNVKTTTTRPTTHVRTTTAKPTVNVKTTTAKPTVNVKTTTAKPRANVNVKTTTARPTPNVRTTTAKPTPNVNVKTTTARPTTTRRVSTTHSGTGTASAPEGIKCRIKSTRLSTGGYVTLQGQGLSTIKSVQINGKNAPLFSKRDNMLTAKVTPGMSSGKVTVTTAKKKTFSCGNAVVR